MSSGLPWLLISDDGVEDGEELSGDCNESGLLRLAGRGKTGIKGFQDGIEPCCDHRRHEQGGAHARSAFALATFLGFAAFVSDANAYVCARGYRGVACGGPRGAVVVRRPYYRSYRYGYRKW